MKHYDNRKFRKTEVKNYINGLINIKNSITNPNSPLLDHVILPSATSFTRHVSDWCQMESALKSQGIQLLVIGNDGKEFLPLSAINDIVLKTRIDVGLNWRAAQYSGFITNKNLTKENNPEIFDNNRIDYFNGHVSSLYDNSKPLPNGILKKLFDRNYQQYHYLYEHQENLIGYKRWKSPKSLSHFVELQEKKIHCFKMGNFKFCNVVDFVHVVNAMKSKKRNNKKNIKKNVKKNVNKN